MVSFLGVKMKFIERIAAPVIQETIKQVTAKFNAEDLILRHIQKTMAIVYSSTLDFTHRCHNSVKVLEQ